jgi:membrane protein involved in colicin uptake
VAPAPSAEKADDAKSKHSSAKAGAKVEKPTKLAKAEAAPKADTPPPAAAAPPPPAPKKASKHDDLDDLLNGATGGGGGDSPKPAKHAEASGGGDENLPEQLDKGAIISGMGKVKGRVSGCFDQFKVPGTYMVSVTIANSGHVSSANVTGGFAGTPTADCVSKAVKGGSFPRFKGSPQTINYPFVLR